MKGKIKARDLKEMKMSEQMREVAELVSCVCSKRMDVRKFVVHEDKEGFLKVSPAKGFEGLVILRFHYPAQHPTSKEWDRIIFGIIEEIEAK